MTTTSSNNPILELKDVTVKYGFSKAIDAVSFEVRKGMALGLIGANGAGKTTSIRALLGMLKVHHGSVEIFGETKLSPNSMLRIGFAPEDASPPEYLSAEEYLGFLAKYKLPDKSTRAPQIKDLLSWFDLDPGKTIRKYSKGMKRRLVLAQAFLGSPELIILDEPLNGLDPIMIQKLREKLIQCRNAGMSILYSSHILSELESSCTDVVMMHKGKVVLKNSVPNLVSQYGSVEKAFASQIGGAQTC